MEGITILSQKELQDVNIWFVLLIIAIVIFAAVVVALVLDDLGILGGIIIGVILVVLLNTVPWLEPNGKFEYECLIDESVSMTEVYEKYEVIGQRGEIWILRDKED